VNHDFYRKTINRGSQFSPKNYQKSAVLLAPGVSVLSKFSPFSKKVLFFAQNRGYPESIRTQRFPDFNQAAQSLQPLIYLRFRFSHLLPKSAKIHLLMNGGNVSKSGDGEIRPWVRIPPAPPENIKGTQLFYS
jgi:hypothetical protein